MSAVRVCMLLLIVFVLSANAGRTGGPRRQLPPCPGRTDTICPPPGRCHRDERIVTYYLTAFGRKCPSCPMCPPKGPGGGSSECPGPRTMRCPSPGRCHPEDRTTLYYHKGNGVWCPGCPTCPTSPAGPGRGSSPSCSGRTDIKCPHPGRCQHQDIIRPYVYKGNGIWCPGCPTCPSSPAGPGTGSSPCNGRTNTICPHPGRCQSEDIIRPYYHKGNGVWCPGCPTCPSSPAGPGRGTSPCGTGRTNKICPHPGRCQSQDITVPYVYKGNGVWCPGCPTCANQGGPGGGSSGCPAPRTIFCPHPGSCQPQDIRHPFYHVGSGVWCRGCPSCPNLGNP